MTDMTPTHTLPDTDPAVRLADLEAEAAALDSRIRAARRNADVDEWLRLQNRQDDLPAEIEQARVAALRDRLRRGWDTVDATAVAEQTATGAVNEIRSAIDDHTRGTRQDRVRPGTPEAARRHADLVDLNTRLDAAKWEEAEAMYALDVALHEVCTIEDQLYDLAGDEPVNGPGLRARPRPLGRHMTLPKQPMHRIRDGGGHLGEKKGYDIGCRPPRWLAHRLPEKAFATRPDATHTEPSTQQHAADELAHYWMADRLLPGNQNWARNEQIPLADAHAWLELQHRNLQTARRECPTCHDIDFCDDHTSLQQAIGEERP